MSSGRRAGRHGAFQNRAGGQNAIGGFAMTLYRDNNGNGWFSDIVLDSDSSPILDAVGRLTIADWGKRVTVTNATNAAPIVITAAGHTFQNGDRVLIIRVRGNKAANGPHTVAGVSGNTFQLSGSTGDDAFIANITDPALAVPIMEGADALDMEEVGNKILAGWPASVDLETGKQYLVFGEITNYGVQIERLENAVTRG